VGGPRMDGVSAPTSADHEARAAQAAQAAQAARADRGARAWWFVGLGVLALSAWPVLRAYLVDFPDEIWQVDLQVYREGARSLVDGREVYDWLTDNPQYLPFTYPPFAGLMGTPLLLLPWRVVGWVWAIGQLVLLWVCVGIAFRPLAERFGRRRGLAVGAVAALLVHLQPVQEGIRFGQVNAILVVLCLADLARARAGWWPRGSLVGLAAAVKLTPGVFWVHFAVTRRWRALAASVAGAAAATGLTALFAPSASAAFWTDALLDPGRLGPNANTQNQSMRGVLLRLGPPEGPLFTLTWLVLVAVVAVIGFRLAARLHAACDQVAVVATMGMIAALVSPVSWTHHYYWGVVVLGALVADGRDRRRLVVAAGLGALLWFNLPFDGAGWQRAGGLLAIVGHVAEQSDCWFAVGSLAALWFFSRRTGVTGRAAAGLGAGGLGAGGLSAGGRAAASAR